MPKNAKYKKNENNSEGGKESYEKRWWDNNMKLPKVKEPHAITCIFQKSKFLHNSEYSKNSL